MAFNNFYPYQQPMNPALFNQQNRLAQMEQMYPSFPNNPMPPQQGLSGRFVDDISTVVASEVAMDGSPSVFIKKDLSEVYLKRWNQNGLIDTSVYKIQMEEPQVKDIPEVNPWEELNTKLIAIEEKLNKVLAVKKPSTKKEADTE